MKNEPKLPDNVEITVKCALWVGLSRKDAPVSIVVSPCTAEIELVAPLLSGFEYDPSKPAYPVYDENKKVVGCLS